MKKENYQDKRQAKGKKKGTLKEKYAYRDEQRKILFYCLRYEEPKGFSQGYYKDNKWIPNLKGIRRILYRLPELIKGKDPVFLVEGERDTDNLREKFNLTATCNSMGAGKWKVQEKEYNRFLKDRELFIVPDNDLLDIEKNKIEAKHLVGEKHLIQVARSLENIVKSFKVFRLPGANDFSDWLEIKGNTEEKFLMLMSEAQEWKDIRKETISNIKKLEKEIKERKDKEQSTRANTNLKSQEPELEAVDQKKIKHDQWTLIPGLIHLVQDGNRIKYLLKNKGGYLYIKKRLIEDHYSDKGEITERIIYTPDQTLPIGFSTSEVLNLQGKVDFADLLAEVMDYIEQRLEMPDESGYLILALWIFHTYLIEQFKTTPIVYVTGVKETGKGRLGEILAELCFRGQVLTTPTEASIFREAHYFKPALIVDEVKLWGFGANEPVASLVNNRYKRGVYVTRIAMDKKGEKQVEHYDVFGATAITTKESIEPSLKSRCIVFTMQRNLKPEVERPLDYEKAQILRNKLTIFRAKFIGKELPAYEQIARGRLNEILLPLYQILISVKPAWKPEFKEIIKSLRGQKKVEESLTLEYDILQVIIDRLGGQIMDLCILTQKIAEAINKDIGEKAKPISDRAIAFRCNRLGFEIWRGAAGKRGFRIKRELLKSLTDQYEIEYQEKPVK